MNSIPFIIGQTASGKKALSHYAALQTGCSIVSVDSMKIYRYMDIGTAKPSADMRNEVQYHMIDIADPSVDKDLKWFLEQIEILLEDDSGSQYIFSGGSSMYIQGIVSGIFEGPAKDSEFRQILKQKAADKGTEALHAELKDADPEAASRIHPNDLKRIIRALEIHRTTGKSLASLQTQFGALRGDMGFTLIGIRYERSRLYKRINTRVNRMFEQGFVEEVRSLYEQDRFGPTSSQAIGYRELIDAFKQNGNPDLDEVKEQIKKNTRVFARKQMTWFKKFKDVYWIDAEEGQTVEEIYKEIKPLLI